MTPTLRALLAALQCSGRQVGLRPAALLGVGVISLACTDTAPRAVGHLAEVRDSAGVILPELPADPTELAAPDLPIERTYQIGSDRSGLELVRVAGARFMADGWLVVADGGALDLALVDPMGRPGTRIGRRGEGPGEFMSISSVHVTNDGTILVFDDLLGRLTEFDGAGGLLTTRQRIEPHPGLDLVPLMASMSGPLVAVYGDNRVLGRGPIVHDTTPLLRYSSGSTRPDTLSLWPTKVWSLSDVGIGGLRVELAFGPDLLSFGQVDRFALAETHGARVSVMDENGSLTRDIRWGQVAAPVTEADVERFRAERADQLSDDIPEVVRQGYLEVPAYETRPLLRGIALDRDGGVWVAPASLGLDGVQTWLVVDRLGAVQGGVQLPTGSSILDVRNGRVATVNQDEYGRDIISVYRLTFGGA